MDESKNRSIENQTESTVPEDIQKIRIPIWLKLSLSTTFIICFTIIILSALVLKRQRDQLYNQSVKAGMISLNYFVNNSKTPLIKGDTLRLNSLIKEAASVDGVLYAVIINETNTIKAHTDIKLIGSTFKRQKGTYKETREGEVSYYSYMDKSGRAILNLSRSVIFMGKMLGEVHVGMSIGFIENLIYKAKLFIIWLSLLIILLGIIMSVLISLGFSRPIRSLVNAAREVGKGNLKHRIKTKRRDEIGNLSRAFNHMAEDLWKDSLMKDSFGKYIGNEVLEMIMENPESPWIKGHRSEATILFTDIRGFTAYSESRDPEDVVNTLNRYFDITSSLILKHGGYVDKFIGDAVLAIFGVPIHSETHIEAAVKAAVEIQEKLKSAAMDSDGDSLLAHIGIAIHSGIVVSGNIGSNVKMEYTVIGDAVNSASRLNGLAGSGEIVISKVVRDGIKDELKTEVLPEQKLKGKSEVLEIYKILDNK